jgi:hypothetical protein
MTTGKSEGMDYASLEVPWEGDEAVQRMIRLRWVVTMVYIIIVIAGGFVPFLWPELDEGLFVVVYMVMVVGGALALILVLTSPLLRPPRSDVSVADGLAKESGVTRKLRPGETFYLQTRFNLILYIMVPMIILMAALMVYIDDMTTRVIMGVVTAFLAILAAIFINFTVKADRRTLSFKFGPFGKVLPLSDIRLIRVTKVSAMKDFMGYGVRIGPDGTIGYITQGDVGFRVETVDEKRYVVTIPEPEQLVEYVKAAIAANAEA